MSVRTPHRPMNRALSLAAIGLIGALLGAAAENAAAQTCRFQEMRLLQLQGSGGSQAEIDQARAMLDACQGNGPVPDFWNNSGNSNNWWGNSRRQEEPQREVRPGGTLRTWCVRRCDGYYFPISFSTTPEHLEYDDTVCRALCPAAEAELFYHYLRGEGPEQMHSLTGEAYIDLETAFSYRVALKEDCTCGSVTVPTNAPSYPPIVTAAAGAPLPRPRPPIGRDPETALNSRGGFEFETLTASRRFLNAGPLPNGSSVRVILPDLGMEESDSVMISPVPNPQPGAPY